MFPPSQITPLPSITNDTLGIVTVIGPDIKSGASVITWPSVAVAMASISSSTVATASKLTALVSVSGVGTSWLTESASFSLSSDSCVSDTTSVSTS